MPAVNPGPSSSSTANTQPAWEAQGTATQAALAFATLPPAAGVPTGSTAFTSDLGPVVSNGTNWLPIATQGAGGTLTYATLPAAGSVPVGTTFYTTDKGEVVTSGTTWVTSSAFSNAVQQAKVVAQSGLPLYVMPTLTSISAAGAIVLPSNLSLATTGSPFYAYFKLAQISTASAAGWYFCKVAADAAHHTVYNNTWTGTGVPLVPASPTAFAGLSGSSLTGSTGAVTATFALPANSMGPNGSVEMEYVATYLSSGGNKTVSVAFGTLSGPTTTATTTTSLGARWAVRNSGVTNVQITTLTTDSTYATATQVLGFGAVDTTSAVNIVLTINNAAATDFVAINSYSIKVFPA